MTFDPVYTVLVALNSALVGLVIWQERRITSGDLVARQVVVDLRTEAKDRLAREKEISDEKDRTNKLLTEALDKQGELLRKVVDGQELTREVLESLRHVARRASPELPSGGGVL
jgi:hypothetical protein